MYNGSSWAYLWYVALAALVLAPSSAEAEQGKRREVADLIGAARANPTISAVPGKTGDRVRLGQGNANRAVAGALPGPVGAGVTWLEGNQNPDGSWGATLEMIVTATAVESLASVDPGSASVGTGAAWLAGQTAANHDFLARQIIALATVPGFEGLVSDLTADLLAARNPAEPNPALPNWPEGGWGLAPGFETDCLTTALALWALDSAGLAGGFSVKDEPLAPGGENVHQWDIPGDAVTVRIVISVAGSTVRVRMTEGSPPDQFDPFFELPPGDWLLVYPDFGIPFTPGVNFISIESTRAAATYTMTASYETPTFDTRTLAEPLAYLSEAQNGDGGWGIQRGQPTEFYTTLHVLLSLLKYSQYDFEAELADGIAFLKSQQLEDGAFGFGAPSIAYVTALGALNLVRSEAYPFGSETEDAIAALLAMQEMDGSWDQQAYDTALAVLALWDHNQDPIADAGPDQMVDDIDEDCFEDVTLAGSGVDPDGTIEAYTWTEDGEVIATGPSPVVSFAVGTHLVELTVTDDGGKTASDEVIIDIVGTGDPSDVCHCCFVGDVCQELDPTACTDSGGTPLPGACVSSTACCFPDGTCQMADPTCCAEDGGTSLPGEACTATAACCLPGGGCAMLDPLCCVMQGGTVQDSDEFCGEAEACCLPEGSCEQLDPLCCIDQGGTPQGAEAMCDVADTDGDGVVDNCDPCPLDNPDDTDGDGVCDSDDTCPLDNPDDTDGDGVCDSDDICPGGDDNVDADGDGVPDFCDLCPADNPDDTDGDGVCDSNDICPGGDDNVDTDGDGVPDFCDPCPADNPDDTDGDGVCDSDDICPGGDDNVDTDGDGVPDFCDPCPADNPDDTDGDGVCDSNDICPGGDDNVDTDGDGVPDFCDPCPADNPDDTDGDGVCDSEDICPNHSDPDQADCDDDGNGDVCTVAECPDEPACSDCNENGIPDACDIAAGAADKDGNGIPDECEGPMCGDCPTDANGDSETGPFDLASLLACWGPVTPGCECFDANGDGDIGPFDLATLLANWGGCP